MRPRIRVRVSRASLRSRRPTEMLGRTSRRHGRLQAPALLSRLAPSRCGPASAAPAASGRPWPSSFSCSLRRDALGSCLAVVCIRAAHAAFACQFTHTRFARARSLAAKLHNASYARVRSLTLTAYPSLCKMPAGASCTSFVRRSCGAWPGYPCAAARPPWLAGNASLCSARTWRKEKRCEAFQSREADGKMCVVRSQRCFLLAPRARRRPLPRPRTYAITRTQIRTICTHPPMQHRKARE
jgi:hypothetical protein